MASRRVSIAHKNGQRYDVFLADFKRESDGEYQGFSIVGYEDGTDYDGPKTAAAIDKAREKAKAPDAPEGGTAATKPRATGDGA